MFWGLIFLVRAPGPYNQKGGSEPLLLGENRVIVIILLSAGCHSSGYGSLLYYDSTPPTCLVGPPLIFSHRRSFLVASHLFHDCACVLSHFSCGRICATSWTAACQTPLSMGFSRQEYWSGFPCPCPGDLPDPGIKPASLAPPASAGDSLPLAPLEAVKVC